MKRTKHKRKRFKNGSIVRIVKVNDPKQCGANARRMVGHAGKVMRWVYDCGATFNDPMYCVILPDGRLDVFWGEELEAL